MAPMHRQEVQQSTADRAMVRDKDGKHTLRSCGFLPLGGQAALGADIEVPSLNGNKKLSIPPGAQSGQVFTLRGHGIQHLNGFGKGDQHVQIIVKIPTKLNKRQKEILKEFASLEGKAD